MTEAEFDRRVRGMEGRMYRTARAMLKNEFDCAHPAPEQNRDLDVQAALEALPEKQRLCVALHHLSGYSVPEIARMLTLPQATVKGRIREGLRKMKQMLEEEP